MRTSNSDDSRSLFLALDQGGHASRAIVFDWYGKIMVRETAVLQTHRTVSDRVEHDATELLCSIRQVLDRAAASLGPRVADVRAGGLATQRSSVVCWDRESGTPLSPVISWQDRRGAAWLGRLSMHAKSVQETTGLVLSPHYGASKLRWCLDHLPAVRRALRQDRLAWGPMSSFILFQILAERPLQVDPANASRTLLWDWRTGDWSPRLLELFGLPATPLPRCVPNRFAFGGVGFGGRRVPLQVSTGDQSAALFASGMPRTDAVYVNVGTGGFLQAVLRERPVSAGRLLCSVVWHDGENATYGLEGTVNGAGNALGWLRKQLQSGQAVTDDEVARWLIEPCDPPLFLNGISGLGSPFWRSDFASRFVGEGDVRKKVVAVVESIVFLLTHNLEELVTHTVLIREIVMSGGLAVLDGLCQRLADLSGLPVKRLDVHEATSRGLAFLVAGNPPDGSPNWCITGEGTSFPPLSNPVLHGRYQRWCKAMSVAVE